MASKQTTVDCILKQIADAGVVTAKKMFGEYGVYCDEKIVALVCDDRLFLKPTLAGEEFLGTYTEGFPYPGAKPWFVISSEKWDDRTWLSQLVKLTAAELPLPKPKKPRKK
jgi:TfoX/Sxy family transcriptional regulator of competence genes